MISLRNEKRKNKKARLIPVDKNLGQFNDSAVPDFQTLPHFQIKGDVVRKKSILDDMD
jgi:hypothetical protein